MNAKFYNKLSQDDLTEVQQEAFYSSLGDGFEGAEQCLEFINECWDSSALEHSWTLPDGHVARVKVTEMVNARIEVDELEHTTFTYRFEQNMPSTTKTSLAPNVIHSIDGYIVREMVRRAHAQGFELLHIHDNFLALPHYMNRVRRNYKEILAEIAQSDLLADILSEITGTTIEINKPDISRDILKSEYALS